MARSRAAKIIVSMAYLISIVGALWWISIEAAIGLVAVGSGATGIVYISWLGGYIRRHPDAGFWDLRLPEKTGEDEKLDRLCEWVYLLLALVVIAFFLIFLGSQ